MEILIIDDVISLCDNMTAIELFTNKNDNDAYLHWINDNPDGFVLNTEKRPRSVYLMLHKVSCYTISKLQPQAVSWTERYNKICSNDKNEIEKWARQNVPGFQGLRYCEICEP